ncbi:hypothetical protein DPMN_032055 [Dreissena polymorpha]|nr:hypothetical protein DPMN_032055 [Dreissena polymorpha]
MGSFVTPVGFKESEYEHVEWRICFNTGESELVTNLNDTQVKLYVLLKMIKQDLLKPRNKVITSYTLKNIVLWLAENNPQTLFHEMSLFFWLREALSELRRAISSKQLPYFMIPERNLMASCKLTDAQQRRWISKITDLIDEGPIIIQRLPKMRRAIIAHPETLRWFYMRRLELEILILEEMNRQNRSSNSNLAVNCFDGIFRQEPTRRMFKIVFEILNRMCPDERNL